MIADFADLCTSIYVVVDERYRSLALACDQRPGPRAAFTDSALISLTLTAELLGLDAETRFLAYVRRNHLARFPLLPERSRYNRRRRLLVEVTNRIRGGIMARLWRVLEAEGRALCVIDSLPVPVVGDHHAAGDHRWWGEADFGRVPSKKQRAYGFKLHLLISHSGFILCQASPVSGSASLSLTAVVVPIYFPSAYATLCSGEFNVAPAHPAAPPRSRHQHRRGRTP